jgi:hypothetical protein
LFFSCAKPQGSDSSMGAWETWIIINFHRRRQQRGDRRNDVMGASTSGREVLS